MTNPVLVQLAFPSGLEFVAAPICIHADSLISTSLPFTDTKSDSKVTSHAIRVADLNAGAMVLAANNKLVKVLAVVHCKSRTTDDSTYHECVVFEPDSLGPNLPTRRFAIDPRSPNLQTR